MSPLNQQILLKSFKNLLCIAAEKEIQLLLWKKEDDMRPEKERGKKINDLTFCKPDISFTTEM
ncbi:hypothetical protein ERO13_D07G172950v2 [Gossypium hirsutum]|uniref:Uncharacterized protein n=2 Tax=Gossypium TaxID=3633 RepID=A0A5D2UCE6_GOSMU|nr:hypothetical protein ERO13_D07G172950v2 [Gossypium hirsutum]TYH63548.1 hypothetical protein ES332_D07G200200v1 [Gossypium tomentosum]TYI74353.1 hypothetical protein E1A91_D07G194400v1 [Gossypium mustelinum]TYI74354.1 hypothetical protein E1A91_D07G194400v1 [Gossypium mustelinum]